MDFRRYVVFFVIFHLSFYAVGQNKIEGIIVDSLQAPIAGATVKLYNLNDTATIKQQTLSDSVGRFRINNVKWDTTQGMLLEISHINFLPFKKVIFQHDSLIVATPLPNSNTLKEVTVVSQKPTFSRSSGKFIFDIANSSLAAGNSVWYVLKHTPLIDIDPTGKISLISSGVTVYINDRQCQLEGTQLVEYLSNMPASNIVRIEIYPVAPAKYQSSGSVINIILKKIETDGLKGNLTLTDEQAFYNSYSGQLFLNYHHNKYTQALNLSAGHELRMNDEKITNDLIDSSQYFYYKNFSKSINNYWNASTTIDYDINPKNSLGGLLQLQGNKVQTRKQNIEEQYTDDYLVNSYQNLMPTKTNLSFIASNLYYKFQNDAKKTLFQVNFDFLARHNPAENTFISLLPGANDTIAGNQIYTVDDLRKFTFQIDYKQDIFKKIDWEIGVKSNIANVKNPYNYFDLNGSKWQSNTALSNFFTYHEKINSAYNTFGARIGKFDFKAGARVELTSVNFDQQIGNQRYAHSYANFIPVLNLGYSVNNNNIFSLDIGNYPMRPAYTSLNPFVYNLGNNYYQTGNPNLKASPSLISTLNYIFKQNYIFGLQYFRLSNTILFTNIVANDSIISKPFNGGNDQVFIFNSVVNIPPVFKKSLKFSITQKFSYNKSKDYAPQLDVSIKSFSYNLRINGDFNLPAKGLQGFISGQYLPPTNFGYLKWKSIYTLDAGIIKDFEKPQIKVNIQFNNVTHFGLKSTNASAFIKSYTENYNGDQAVRLSLIKSFGNKKSKDIKGNSIDQSRLGKDSKTKF